MKITIKKIGLLAAFVLAMFLNSNTISSDKSLKFNLADAISMQSANAECPPHLPEYMCDDDPTYDGEIETPSPYECNYQAYDPNTGEYLFSYVEVKQGTGCDWVTVPSSCMPWDPC